MNQYHPNTREAVRRIIQIYSNLVISSVVKLTNKIISEKVCALQKRPFVKLSGSMIREEREKAQKILLFTYGSLLNGMSRHHILERASARFMGITTVSASLHTFNWSWPFLVLNPGNNLQVKGEVYEIRNELIEVLDQIEGYKPNREGNLFERRVIEIDLNGKKATAIVYEGGRELLSSTSTFIQSGDWKAAYKDRYEKANRR